jgi:IPT/TIG domain
MVPYRHAAWPRAAIAPGRPVAVSAILDGRPFGCRGPATAALPSGQHTCYVPLPVFSLSATRRRLRRAAFALSFIAVWLLPGVARAGGPSNISFDPGQGPAGTPVDLAGIGFTGATAVSFNGVAATFTEHSDVHISTHVPNGATTGPIAVTTPGGTGESAEDFVVIVPPVISDFTPDGGTWKETVTITGSGFSGVFSVRFNGKEAPLSGVSDTTITVRVPSGAGVGPIRVENAAGADVSDRDFQFRRIRHRVVLKMHLEDHLVAIGRVTLPNAGARARFECAVGRRVTIKRKISGVFRSVAHGESEGIEGRFQIALTDREGNYRAIIKPKLTQNRRCLPDRSLVEIHQHA